jgi:dienelactone hydrolase
MRKWLSSGILLATVFLVDSLAAQHPTPAEVLPTDIAKRAATLAGDLVFPDRLESPGDLERPRMALLKPVGAGPFPAIVLVHQCAGLNQAVLAWARRATQRDYVVLVLDSFSSRGVTSVCYGPKSGVNLFRGVRDALQAAQHLRTKPFVDADRIALVGFSWGGMVGLLSSSPHYVSALDVGPGFAAVASFYPGCFRITPPNGRPFEIVTSDIAKPLLVLMGEVDTETPPADCIKRLDPLKTAGSPVEWHMYQQTTHCWDCKVLDGFSKIDVRGNVVYYRYQQSVVDDSEKRLFEFLERSFARR